jgi:hypothetical protein
MSTADLLQGQRTAPASTPRPTRHSNAVLEGVAQDLTPEVCAWLGDVNRTRDPDLVKADLLEALRRAYFDGYDLARYLDSHGWDSVDAQLVEILNSASSIAWSHERDAVRAWALGQGDALTLALGAVVDTPYGRGAIVHLDADQLTYGVRPPDGPTNGWTIVPYERCTPVEAS